jgi:superfamily II DNA or RNA helicase
MLRLSFDRGTLTLQGVSRVGMQKLLGAGNWAWDPRVNQWRCDAIHYAVVAARLRQTEFAVQDDVRRWHAISWTRIDLPQLRFEQRQARDHWLAARRGCIVMPTGTGKTEVALSIMAALPISTLIVAPVRDLMYQWHHRLRLALHCDAGILGDKVRRVRAITVTTYDSACIHMERLGNLFGLLVFDECHHLPGEMRRDAARMSAAPFRLGLTATPVRSDGRHVDLDWLVGPIVYQQTVEAARGRSLAEYDVVRIPVHLVPQEQSRYDSCARIVRAFLARHRRKQRDYDWQQLCADAQTDPHARQVLRAYRAARSIEERAEEKLRVLEDLFRLHVGEPCLVFAGSNAMARDVSLRFLIPCLLSHCGKDERQEALQGLASGRYPALVANQVLDEGVDVPEVKVAIVIGGGSSARQAQQRLGRVLRKGGNARATLYEVVCEESREQQRSRRRRRNDAYQGQCQRRALPK